MVTIGYKRSSLCLAAVITCAATTGAFSEEVKVNKLENVVVTASKSTQKVKDVTEEVSLLTAEEISERGYTTVNEALNSMPGISVVANGPLGSTSSVLLRGMDTKYTLVLIDGVKYNDPSSTSGANLSHLLIGDIERIEVIKGAQSGVWGADAAAGVINIITKEAKAGTHGSISSELGSYNTKKLGMTLSHKNEKWDSRLSVQRVTSDGFSSQSPRGTDIDDYEDDPYQNTTIDIKTGYWLADDTRLEAGYHDINALTNYDGFNAPNSTQRSDYRSKAGFVRVKNRVGKHNIELETSHTKSVRKQLDATFGVSDFIGKINTIELKDSWAYTKNATLVGGLHYEKNRVNYVEVSSATGEKDFTNKAVFLNHNISLGNWRFQQAVRYDKYDAFKDKTTGKLGVKYFLDEDFSLHANYGSGYKVPSMIEMMNPWGTSNLDINPESIKSLNTGLSYKKLHVNYFNNKINDMIQWDGGNYANLEGTSTLKGVEVSFDHNLNDTTLLNLNYTYLDAKDKTGKRLLRRPRNKYGINVTWFTSDDITTNINGTYVGNRIDSGTPTPQTGNYFVADAKVSYSISNDYNLYVKVNNIFDRYYQTINGYSTAERSFYIGFTANF